MLSLEMMQHLGMMLTEIFWMITHTLIRGSHGQRYIIILKKRASIAVEALDYYLLDCCILVNGFIMFYLLLHVGMKKEASHVLRKH
jgi:hypothetical protein